MAEHMPLLVVALSGLAQGQATKASGWSSVARG
jgi:hypothetical protein